MPAAIASSSASPLVSMNDGSASTASERSASRGRHVAGEVDRQPVRPLAQRRLQRAGAVDHEARRRAAREHQRHGIEETSRPLTGSCADERPDQRRRAAIGAAGTSTPLGTTTMSSSA